MRRCAVWLWRIGRSGGFGIQSPFAFTFVTGVIYERGAYYAYAPLHEARKRLHPSLRERDDRLLLRIANAVGPRRGIICGDGGEVSRQYLEAGCRRCTYTPVRTADELHRTLARDGAADLIYVADTALWPDVATVLEAAFRRPEAGTGEWSHAAVGGGAATGNGGNTPEEDPAPVSPQGILIVRGIHATRAARRAWRHLAGSGAVGVSFDLYDFGLAFFDHRLSRQSYVVNYF